VFFVDEAEGAAGVPAGEPELEPEAPEERGTLEDAAAPDAEAEPATAEEDADAPPEPPAGFDDNAGAEDPALPLTALLTGEDGGGGKKVCEAEGNFEADGVGGPDFEEVGVKVLLLVTLLEVVALEETVTLEVTVTEGVTVNEALEVTLTDAEAVTETEAVIEADGVTVNEALAVIVFDGVGPCKQYIVTRLLLKSAINTELETASYTAPPGPFRLVAVTAAVFVVKDPCPTTKVAAAPFPKDAAPLKISIRLLEKSLTNKRPKASTPRLNGRFIPV